jgi:hypothetical protein
MLAARARHSPVELALLEEDVELTLVVLPLRPPALVVEMRRPKPNPSGMLVRRAEETQDVVELDRPSARVMAEGALPLLGAMASPPKV